MSLPSQITWVIETIKTGKPVQATEPKDNVQIVSLVYGPKEITNPNVLGRFSYALKRGLPITVGNDELGGDPQFGVLKTATAKYQLTKDGPVLRKAASEGQLINFRVHVSSLGYGPILMTDENVYAAFNAATDANQTLAISNGTFGGDPQFGVVKQADIEVTYVTDQGHWTDSRFWMTEGDTYLAKNASTYHA